MITVYSKTHCAHCINAKNYLQSRDIRYREVNIDEDAQAREFVMAQGHRTVPQLYVGEQLLVEGGWSGLSKLSTEEILQRMQSASAIDDLGTL
jgi:glutaredoxin 3